MARIAGPDALPLPAAPSGAARAADRAGVAIDLTIYHTSWGTRESGIQQVDERDIAFGQLPGAS